VSRTRTPENPSGTSINVSSVRIARPSAMGTSGTNGSYVRSIKKSTGAIGATKLLKVMAGDRIRTSVDYYYTIANSATNNGGANPLTSFVNSLTSIFVCPGMCWPNKGAAAGAQSEAKGHPPAARPIGYLGNCLCRSSLQNIPVARVHVSCSRTPGNMN
jgi:hypothetical protein